MLLWAKGLIVFGGLVATSLIHFMWPNKPQEEVLDNHVVEFVKDITAFDIDPIEEIIDDIEDSLNK